MDEAALEALLEEARTSHGAEIKFFRALLDAVVYVHAPLSDDHPRTRLITFHHPDGFTAIPFFTSPEKAQVPAGITAKIVTVMCRDLFLGSQGGTFMLNPNDGGPVLYPEEISELLETGTIAKVVREDPEQEPQLLILEEANPPAWLMVTLMARYTEMPFVKVAYLLELVLAEAPERHRFLVVIGVAPEYAERAARATITAIQSMCAQTSTSVDLRTFNPADGMPDYVRQPGVERFYGPSLC